MRSVLVQIGRFTCRCSMMRGFRRKAFSAASSDLLLAKSVNVPSSSDEVSGLVQATKLWWID